jgi:hypothetical protein
MGLILVGFTGEERSPCTFPTLVGFKPVIDTVLVGDMPVELI